MTRIRELDTTALIPPMGKFPTGAYGGSSDCPHDGGSRADTGEWECSGCGRRWPSYEAWGEDTDNQDAVHAVRAAIQRDLERDYSGAAGPPPWANVSGSRET